MADLMTALRNADKAGDTEAAKRIAAMIKLQQGTDQQLEAKPGARVQAFDSASMQKTLVTPSEDTALGAMVGGARRGLETIGEGVLQRSAEVAEFLGFDTSDFQGKLKLSGDISEQRFKQTKEDRPISSTIGEIAGSVAGFPVAPAKVPQAIAAGAAYGLTQPTDKGSDIALNVVQEGLMGGVGSWAAPYVQKGFNKSQAMFSGLYKKATGVDPRPEMFSADGVLSDDGRKALEEIGISSDEFARLYAQTDQNFDPIASTRLARSEEQGIPLTTAQATKDFQQQEAEQTLRASLGREGNAARAIEQEQQQAIKNAQERFERGIAPEAPRDQRGADVQQALRDLKKQGGEEVSGLYSAAREIEGSSAQLNGGDLLDEIDFQFERPVGDDVVNSVEKLLAKYGLLDGEIEKAGRFNQILTADGGRVKFRGEQTPLTLDNAESFRQSLNQILPADKSGAVGNIIKKVDSLVGDAVKQLPQGSEKTKAFENARGAFRKQKEIFNQKDIIQNLVGFKNGTMADVIQPDRVIDSIIKGGNAKGNLRRVKQVLMNNPTNKTLDAWKSIQAQGVADLFGKSINPATGDISGARLKTAIKSFGGGSEKEGKERLKMLLGEKYKQFDNLVQSIGDATIPIKGVTNPSGTAYKLMNFMQRAGSVGSLAADAVIGISSKVKDSAKSRAVLRNIEKATPEKVKQAVKANDDMIDAFVRLGLTGTLRDQ